VNHPELLAEAYADKALANWPVVPPGVRLAIKQAYKAGHKKATLESAEFRAGK
jgi:hypothetical protein